MKGGQNLRDLQAKKKQAEENSLPPCTCMICGKQVEGYYARFGDEGVCDNVCMRVQAQKPRFPNYEEADYERRQCAVDA
jgi:hypothetical protein